MVQLVALPQALQAGQGLSLAGLRDQHRLEAPRQRRVRLQVLPAVVGWHTGWGGVCSCQAASCWWGHVLMVEMWRWPLSSWLLLRL